jgi:hypothetical protein
VELEIHRSARKHGVPDTDIRHVVSHALVARVTDDDQVLYLGPDAAGNLLEVVTVAREDGSEIAVHAMKMRKGYRALLQGGEHD